MTRKVVLTALSIALALGLLAGCGGAVSSANGSSQLAPLAAPGGNEVLAGVAGTGDSSASLTEEQAKQIALEDAGLSADAVTFLRVKLDRDDGRSVYDVEFYQNQTEYDYEIDAASGKILSSDRDIESYTPSASAAEGQIGLEDARQVALSHAGLSADAVTFVKEGLDYDDGRAVYEFEFYQGTTEYDYEIDAASGEILSFDQDAEFYAPTAQSGTKEITAAEAKAIALAHAGVSEADARGLEMDTDRDNGRTVYEFEWEVGRVEYSCDVDAATGEVVAFERDAD